MDAGEVIDTLGSKIECLLKQQQSDPVEWLFLCVNMKNQQCTSHSSDIGESYLKRNINLVDSFHSFCKEKYNGTTNVDSNRKEYFEMAEMSRNEQQSNENTKHQRILNLKHSIECETDKEIEKDETETDLDLNKQTAECLKECNCELFPRNTSLPVYNKENYREFENVQNITTYDDDENYNQVASLQNVLKHCDIPNDNKDNHKEKLNHQNVSSNEEKQHEDKEKHCEITNIQKVTADGNHCTEHDDSEIHILPDGSAWQQVYFICQIKQEVLADVDESVLPVTGSKQEVEITHILGRDQFHKMSTKSIVDIQKKQNFAEEFECLDKTGKLGTVSSGISLKSDQQNDFVRIEDNVDGDQLDKFDDSFEKVFQEFIKQDKHTVEAQLNGDPGKSRDFSVVEDINYETPATKSCFVLLEDFGKKENCSKEKCDYKQMLHESKSVSRTLKQEYSNVEECINKNKCRFYTEEREEGPYCCIFCPKKFMSKKSLKQHSLNHIKNSKDQHFYKCQICDKEFKSRKGSVYHMKFVKCYKDNVNLEVHEGQGCFSCRFCSRVYSRKEHLQRHQMNIHGLSSTAKSILSQSSKTKSSTNFKSEPKNSLKSALSNSRKSEPRNSLKSEPRNSLKSASSNSPKSEPRNSLKSEPRNSLKSASSNSPKSELRNSHKPEPRSSVKPESNNNSLKPEPRNSLKEKSCSTAKPNLLKTAIKNLRAKSRTVAMATESNISVMTTGKPSMKRTRRDNPIFVLGYKDYRCELCKKPYHNFGLLKIHLKRIHASLLSEKWLNYLDLGPTVNKTTKRNRASMSFDKKEHSDFKDLPSQSDKNCIKTKRLDDFKRNVCGTVYKSGLADHKIQMGNHRNNSSCPDCGKKFPSELHLKYHYNAMHKNENFSSTKKKIDIGHVGMDNRSSNQCTVCLKTFVGTNELQHHMLVVHTHLLKKRCNICKREFKNRKTLRNHVFVHMEKKLACQVCNRMYSDMKRLRAHIKDCHPGIHFQCNKCGDLFYVLADYEKHKKIHDS